ncbi:MAG TPA: FkbM family methyltransferase, partial [Solirubrobacteraceae bacterium]|nr:FkbM family methyltransferase [Solirubrobacteraceae bacterium]
MPRELWRECVFLLAGRRRETLTVRWPAGTFVVSTRDLDVSRRTFVAGPYGLERLLRAGELVAVRGREVLEVGANIGTTTIPLVTLLGAARVHAFEPVARNFALLERNVELNGLGERVALHRAAV